MDKNICKKCTAKSGLKRDDCPAKDNDRCHYSPAKVDGPEAPIKEQE